VLSTLDAAVLILALVSVWAMTGVIWVVQLVHYPAFAAVERGPADVEWRRFGDHHRASMSLVVGPFMLVEGVTGLWLLADPPADVGRLLPFVAAILMAVAYGTTAFVSVPLHARLTERFDTDAHGRLVSTNWIRTGAWTIRGGVVGVIALVALT
jgi:hypothetical protein